LLLYIFSLGPFIKVVHNQGGGVCVQCGQEGSSDANVRTFLRKNILIFFWNLWCVRTKKGGGDRVELFCGQGGNFSRFCAGVFMNYPLLNIWKDFWWYKM